MEFSSATFLFIFLPAVFLLYLIPVKPLRRAVLILASLVFYAWGDIRYVPLLLVSAAVNFVLALIIGKREGKNNRPLLAVAIVFNIGLLAFYKYLGFFIDSLGALFNAELSKPDILSPLGISFFTFQSLSYIIDVSRGDAKHTENPFKFLLYISFFAQLTQGPIIRFTQVEASLDELKPTSQKAADGIRTFIFGLGMKLIIANTLGRVTDYIWSLDASCLNAAYAWTGALAFLLRIYFDFAGYSKMAVGLGLMFGIDIPENFDHPYAALGMTDFWRRWHITLSRWFRDYVYIPLGGNRRGALRTGLNKITVFLLTGLWHGANLTFVVWGAYNGVFLLAETYLKRTKLRFPKPIKWLYTILAVTVGFVIFNSPDLGYAFKMIGSMFAGFGIGADTAAALSKLLRPTVIAVFIAAVIGASPLFAKIAEKLKNKPVALNILRYGSAAAVFILCLFFLASGNYNPSIYTQF